MKAHVFVISMLTGIVVTYAVLLLGCLFIDKTLPTVDVVILSLVVGFCSAIVEGINVNK